MTQYRIVLQGSEEVMRAFARDLVNCATHRGHDLVAVAEEIEDQLEPEADREHDFVDLDAVYTPDDARSSGNPEFDPRYRD